MRLFGKPRIVAAKKQQGQAWIERSGKHFAHNDGVVASNVHGVQTASDLTKNVLHQRNILCRPNEFYVRACFVLLRLIGEREKLGKMQLIFLEDINAKNALFL